MAMLKLAILNAVLATIIIALLTGSNASHQDQKHHHHDYKLLNGPLRKGYEYRFHYDTQTASGYVPWVSTQNAIGRLQMDIRILMREDNQAVFQMENIQEGERHSNGPWNTAEIMPMDAFKTTFRSGEERKNLKLLELPVEFSYNRGIISNVKFFENEQTWSKNIKKAVLSLIQINMQSIEDFIQNNEIDRKNSFVSWEVN